MTTEVNNKGQPRKLVIYFANKSDEQKAITKDHLKLSGRLYDERVQQLISLLNAKLID